MAGVSRDYYNVNTKATAWIGSVKLFTQNGSLKQDVYKSQVFAFWSLTA